MWKSIYTLVFCVVALCIRIRISRKLLWHVCKRGVQQCADEDTSHIFMRQSVIWMKNSFYFLLQPVRKNICYKNWYCKYITNTARSLLKHTLFLHLQNHWCYLYGYSHLVLGTLFGYLSLCLVSLSVFFSYRKVRALNHTNIIFGNDMNGDSLTVNKKKKLISKSYKNKRIINLGIPSLIYLILKKMLRVHILFIIISECPLLKVQQHSVTCLLLVKFILCQTIFIPIFIRRFEIDKR